MKHIVGFSGGIDSQACARWVLNRYPAEDVILLNSDAGGNEHPLTTAFVAEYSRTVHPVLVIQPLIGDLWKTEGFAETRGLDSADPLTFERMIELKGRPPSRKAQFCTEILKLRPQKRWVEQNVTDEYERYTGVRRDESEYRRNTPDREWDSYFDCWTNHPLAAWGKQECFDYVKGEPINPLYTLGFGRVGCAPCINSGKADITRWATRFPEMIEKIRGWEDRTRQTFFSPCVPGIRPRLDSRGKMSVHNWIDEVVEWAKTDRGGRQFNILHDLEVPSCESKFGLCE
ncbi:MAG: phosphoadenosine phosphosulfate reductase family protein [Patescibacteria group bacterium]|nr:phosphoadenosine phosphosulfate reductase family protein [Patescibacteria group bacterium]